MSDENSDGMLVSGWDDDMENVEEECNPHESPAKEILWAAENGELELVKKLIEQDLTLIKTVDKDGYTPLHRACYENHVDVVEYLLENGANVAARTQMGWQPLHSTCQWNHYESALRLLQYSADVNATTEGGQTPLHIAASHGTSYKMVQLLLMQPYIKPDLLNNNLETAYDIAKRSSKYYRIFEMCLLVFQGIQE